MRCTKVAQCSQPESLEWLLSHPAAKRLETSCDLEGETPLQALRTILERKRTAWDDFDGFAMRSVLCLQQLLGFQDALPKQISRLKFGCTCGQCIGGFISPRFASALKYQAQQMYRDIQRVLAQKRSKDSRKGIFRQIAMVNIPFALTELLETDDAILEGLMKTLLYIPRTLDAGQLPTTAHLLQTPSAKLDTDVQRFHANGGSVGQSVSESFVNVSTTNVPK